MAGVATKRKDEKPYKITLIKKSSSYRPRINNKAGVFRSFVIAVCRAIAVEYEISVNEPMRRTQLERSAISAKLLDFEKSGYIYYTPSERRLEIKVLNFNGKVDYDEVDMERRNTV